MNFIFKNQIHWHIQLTLIFRKPEHENVKPKKELSKIDKVLFSNAYIHSSNYYIPEDREHLERKLNNLVSDVYEKHEEILKENEECFRVLDWINEMSQKPLNLESVDKDGYTHKQRVINEIEELRNDNEALRNQLDASKDALDKAIKLNRDLRKNLDKFTSKDKNPSSPVPQNFDAKGKELEMLKNENKQLEKQIEKLQAQNSKKIKEYLDSLDDPVDLDQLGKSFRGLTEEYKDAIKQFHEEKKNLIYSINDANDEYAELVKVNFRQQKKKLEMQNEIEALNNLIDNDNTLKNDIEKVNKGFSDKVDEEYQALRDDLGKSEQQLKDLEKEFGKKLFINF